MAVWHSWNFMQLIKFILSLEFDFLFDTLANKMHLLRRNVKLQVDEVVLFYNLNYNIIT